MIQKNQRIPSNLALYKLSPGDQEKPQQVNCGKYFGGRRVLVFGVPGAFTQVCAQQQLPEYIANMKAFKDLNVDAVACVSTNDPYVMYAWGLSAGAGDMDMLSDPQGEFHKQLGLMQTLPLFGERPYRYAMYVKDGKVEVIKVEEAGDKNYNVCKADTMAQAIQEVERQ